MEQIYGKIANLLNDLIPEDWDKVYMYGEALEDTGIVYFFYHSIGKDEYVYSHYIPEIADMPQYEYYKCLEQLVDNIRELQNEFRKNGQDVWTNLTLMLENTGEFKIDYDYTDLSDVSDYKRQIIWEYKYIRLMPTEGRERKIIEEYLKTQGK